jgi:SAM-dependent methyltransferase
MVKYFTWRFLAELPRGIAYKLRGRLFLLRSYPAQFRRIFQTRGWGGPSLSGGSSTLENTEILRQELPDLLRRHEVRSLLDIPCGDWYWMRQVALDGVEYVGADIVEELIELNRRAFAAPQRRFVVKDLCADELPRVDMILCRDCLIHLRLRLGMAAVAGIRRSGSKYLLMSTYPNCKKNRELPSGFWRPINLRLPPFSFPEPLELLTDSARADASRSERYLGLWRIADLG